MCARIGMSLNQEVFKGTGQPGKGPGRTIRKLRRRRAMAETLRFLTTQGLGGPDGEAEKPENARRTQGTLSQSDAPGSGPAGPGNFGYFPPLESSSPEGETSPIPRPARRRHCKRAATGRPYGLCRFSLSRLACSRRGSKPSDCAETHPGSPAPPWAFRSAPALARCSRRLGRF